jgi:hypothetical protein
MPRTNTIATTIKSTMPKILTKVPVITILL